MVALSDRIVTAPEASLAPDLEAGDTALYEPQRGEVTEVTVASIDTSMWCVVTPPAVHAASVTLFSSFPCMLQVMALGGSTVSINLFNCNTVYRWHLSVAANLCSTGLHDLCAGGIVTLAAYCQSRLQ